MLHHKTTYYRLDCSPEFPAIYPAAYWIYPSECSTHTSISKFQKVNSSLPPTRSFIFIPHHCLLRLPCQKPGSHPRGFFILILMSHDALWVLPPKYLSKLFLSLPFYCHCLSSWTEPLHQLLASNTAFNLSHSNPPASTPLPDLHIVTRVLFL